MNENANKPAEEKKKIALLRYIVILFAAAFVVVLLSLLSQVRNSEQTISELSHSSSSFLQKTEQLQEENQALSEENKALKEQLELLQAQGADAEKITEAYELLLQTHALLTPGAQEGNIAATRALENLKNYETYLGEEGLKIYHSMLEEGE